MHRSIFVAALAALLVAATALAGDGMVRVPAGCFQMGSEHGDEDEKPVHRVCLDSFQMDRTEVTNAQFARTMGRNPHLDDRTCYVWNGAKWLPGVLPRKFLGANQPTVCVDHDQARKFCGNRGERLPTEAEWEYTARAGDTEESHSVRDLARHAWFRDNSGGVTHSVGKKHPNPWGLYDMVGNAWEWVDDWYGATYYSETPVNNPKGPDGGAYRVYRGGGWFSAAQGSGASVRGSLSGKKDRSSLGFRCVDSR